MPDFSPRLKAAMKEVENVCKKHNVGGTIILADGYRFSEYRLGIDIPSWSTARFLREGKVIHTQIYMKTKPEESNRTTNMVIHLRDVTGQMFLMLDKLVKQYGQSVEIVETSPPKWTPHKEDE